MERIPEGVSSLPIYYRHNSQENMNDGIVDTHDSQRISAHYLNRTIAFYYTASEIHECYTAQSRRIKEKVAAVSQISYINRSIHMC